MLSIRVYNSGIIYKKIISTDFANFSFVTDISNRKVSDLCPVEDAVFWEVSPFLLLSLQYNLPL